MKAHLCVLREFITKLTINIGITLLCILAMVALVMVILGLVSAADKAPWYVTAIGGLLIVCGLYTAQEMYYDK